MHLKNSKAYDIYNISTHMIKTIAPHIVAPITHIFNHSLEQGIFPSLLKVAKVVPVHKSKDHHTLNNFRPISILPIISKVFESLMLSRLDGFLTKHNIINTSQHGFRKGFSTTTAAFQFIEKSMNLWTSATKHWVCSLISVKPLISLITRFCCVNYIIWASEVMHICGSNHI